MPRGMFGVAKNLGILPKLKLPPRILTPNTPKGCVFLHQCRRPLHVRDQQRRIERRRVRCGHAYWGRQGVAAGAVVRAG